MRNLPFFLLGTLCGGAVSGVLGIVIYVGVTIDQPPSATGTTSKHSVVVLVPGLRHSRHEYYDGWGQHRVGQHGNIVWDGMIGELIDRGMNYGGVIRIAGHQILLPEHLDTIGAVDDPSGANLFALEFSRSADVDGLAYKTLELAKGIGELRRFTGCEKVRIIAYSAGGLVARTYLQDALPGVHYADDVESLVTIATPHLGSNKAEHFGDYLGTRVTSIKPSAELIVRMNKTLPLPPDVKFASVVVRGVRVGSVGLREDKVDAFVNSLDSKRRDDLYRMPLDYRLGNDHIVNVVSQNLFLTPVGRQYEEETGRAVQFVLARVMDPSVDDLSPVETTVHEVAARDPEVVELVWMLLEDNYGFWKGLKSDRQSQWARRQAEQLARGILEYEMADRHELSEVSSTRLTEFDLSAQSPTWECTFAGEVSAKWRLPPRLSISSRFRGQAEFLMDRFGRVTEVHHDIEAMEP